MSIKQLQEQLWWLLDQLAAVHEAYSSDGKERIYKDPDNGNITQGDYVWRLEQRISSTRTALACRQEIDAGQKAAAEAAAAEASKPS